MSLILDKIQELFLRSIETKRLLTESDHLHVLADIAQAMAACLHRGNKIMLCGNGGSAADAQHLAAELLIRLRSQVERPSLPALTLATDVSSITACGNDYSFEDIFARPLSGLGRAGDILVGLTTSGKSPNVIKALRTAKDMGIITVGFLGGDGEPALSLCDYAFTVPSHETGRVQECHITAGHALLEAVEDLWLANRVCGEAG